MRALVTGASRGIGKAIADTLARERWDVIGTSRTPAPSDPLLPLDLGDEASIDSLAATVGDIDALINNAGGSQIGPIEEVPVAAMRALFERNLFGAVRLTQKVLPSMRERHEGRILFVSSMSGVTPVPFLSVYAASKAALIAIAHGLRQEVAADGIQVSVIAPFDVHTTIPLDLQYAGDSAYLEQLLRVKEVRDRTLAEGADPEDVAKVVLKVLEAPRPRSFYPVGKSAGIKHFLLRHLPARLVERLVRHLYGLPRAPRRA